MKPILSLMILLFFLLCSCSRNEKPDKWVFLSKDKDNAYFYTLDKMSKTDQHLAKIWVKTVFHETRHSDDGDVSYAKNMFMIKCIEKKYKMNVGFNYSPSNEAVSKTDAEQGEALPLVTGKSNREALSTTGTIQQDVYLPILPNSPADRLYGIVCR